MPRRLFSPRAWGWSGKYSSDWIFREVLPTCVGMVRHRMTAKSAGSCSPHVRGDGPIRGRCFVVEGMFSPRAWGWSVQPVTPALPVAVIPTCVGMVRPSGRSRGPFERSPHVRGDGPRNDTRR